MKCSKDMPCMYHSIADQWRNQDFISGGGGVRALGAGPQVLRAPRFSLSAASMGPRKLLRVHERGVIRLLAFDS